MRVQQAGQSNTAGRTDLSKLYHFDSLHDSQVKSKNNGSRKYVLDSYKKKEKRITQQDSKITVLYKNIIIEGDSLSRYLVRLVRDKVTSKTLVKGICRPGPKLLIATSDDTPPPNSCCILVADNNDFTAGQQHNVYWHLEHRIKTKLRTARMIVCTLLQRHDMPGYHPAN